MVTDINPNIDTGHKYLSAILLSFRFVIASASSLPLFLSLSVSRANALNVFVVCLCAFACVKKRLLRQPNDK